MEPENKTKVSLEGTLKIEIEENEIPDEIF
jgi:hypothetical protein